MPGFYQTFTSSRVTEPDLPSLLAQLRALDSSAGIQHDLGAAYRVKKATSWTGPQIAAVQTVIDSAPAASPALAAQSQIDEMPIATKALLLALIDQLNTIRAALPQPLGAITPAQAIAAVRTKAGSLG